MKIVTKSDVAIARWISSLRVLKNSGKRPPPLPPRIPVIRFKKNVPTMMAWGLVIILSETRGANLRRWIPTTVNTDTMTKTIARASGRISPASGAPRNGTECTADDHADGYSHVDTMLLFNGGYSGGKRYRPQINGEGGQ